MTDAEFPAPLAGDEGTSGNFNIIITKDKARKTGQRVQINYRLELRTSYAKADNPLIGKASYEDIMQSLAKFFGVNLYKRERFLFNKLRYFYILIVRASSTRVSDARSGRRGGRPTHNFNYHKIVASYFSEFPFRIKIQLSEFPAPRAGDEGTGGQLNFYARTRRF